MVVDEKVGILVKSLSNTIVSFRNVVWGGDEIADQGGRAERDLRQRVYRREITKRHVITTRKAATVHMARVLC